jgi:dTDP-4-dehydrorhamnose 3,5-epimerase
MSSYFEYVKTGFEGLVSIRRQTVDDERGSFGRLFCDELFKEIGFTRPVRQINESITQKKGTLRGMHFQQPPSVEGKLVMCLSGEIYDVAVDIRKGSATFLQWHAETLSPGNGKSIYIPAGFAHGFQSLSDDCQVLYMHSDIHRPDLEVALNALDPALNISWPLEVTSMSARDREQPLLDPAYDGISTS